MDTTTTVDEVALRSLAAKFPAVSPRILTAALAIYLPLTASLTEALEAAAHRIDDAIAA